MRRNIYCAWGGGGDNWENRGVPKTLFSRVKGEEALGVTPLLADQEEISHLFTLQMKRKTDTALKEKRPLSDAPVVTDGF